MADVNNTEKFKIFPFFKGGGQLFCSNGTSKLKECFELFDSNRDGLLDLSEFECLLKNLFAKRGKPYPLDQQFCKEIYDQINEKQGAGIDLTVFTAYWHKWIKQILDPVTALLIIDVQNDFINGSLAVKNCPAKHNGEEVVPVINKMLDTVTFNVVIYSYDWHPKDHISFIENVKLRSIHEKSKVSAEQAETYDTVVFGSPCVMEQKLWPSHCVQNSKGAELHPDLKVVQSNVRINKGTNPDIDSYSAFWDNNKLAQTTLYEELRKRGVTEVYLAGIAYDVCVGWTAEHALEFGLRTIIVDDACRGIENEGIERMKRSLQEAGAVIVQSNEVADMVCGQDRRPELGLFSARQLPKEILKASSSRPTPNKQPSLKKKASGSIKKS